MNWFGPALRNLWRRPGRSFFTLLGVTIALASFIALTGLARGMQLAARESLDERGVHLLVIRRGSVEFFSAILPQTLGERIAAIPGVVAVSPELSNLLPIGEDTHALVAGWPAGGFQWERLTLLRGRLPDPGEHGLVLGEALAEALHADVGAVVELNLESFPVLGIAGFGAALNRGMAMLPLPELQRLLGRDGQVTLFHLRIERPGDRAAEAAVRTAIQALRRDLAVVTSDEVLSGNRSVAMLNALADALALAALVLAGLSVLNTLAMSVEERTREIGVLAAIGWSRGRILRLILGEGAVLSAAGGVLGAVLGQVALTVLNRLVLAGGGTRAVSGPGVLAAALGFGLLAGVLGALWPAWRATRISPAAAMRRG
ncbi:ABC transporter permease [uncultured Thiodictyon sp.]|uniref:ABC transporter permease n=1 Tax=uncultured Thiodictyon sp. TaxID=1846217 RepID=UPI0025DDE83C|nr:ABC transporter permease [uncultured Thiodictyon sp.]